MTIRTILSACVVALALTACGTTDPYMTTVASPRAASNMPAEQAVPTAASVEYDRPVVWPSQGGDGPSWWYDPMSPSMVVVHARPDSAAWPTTTQAQTQH